MTIISIVEFNEILSNTTAVIISKSVFQLLNAVPVEEVFCNFGSSETRWLYPGTLSGYLMIWTEYLP